MFYEPIWEYEGFTLVKRPDTPNYFIYWRPGSGRRALRYSTRTSDLDAARRKLIEFASRRGIVRKKQAPESVLLLDVLCDYYERKIRPEGKSMTCVKVSLKYLTAFCERDGIRYVAEFDLTVQERFIAWRRETMLRRGYSASNGTINRDLSVIKAATRWMWKQGRLESAPHVELLPSPPPRDRFLRVHEVRRLLDACERPHLRLYVMLALHTLQRPIAIYGLRVEQVDLAWNRIDFLPPGTVQTKKRRPVIPITPSLRPHLERAIQESRTGYVLEYRGRPMRTVRLAFTKACRRAELEKVTPYVLRHTGATLMAAAGVPIWQIAGMLGHSEVRTTEIYAKHHPDFLLDASRALETLFGSGTAVGNGGAPGAEASLPAPGTGDSGAR